MTNGFNVENGSSSVDNSNLRHVISQLSNLSFQNSGPKRTIKLAIFPDNYDKTIIPPLEQGKSSRGCHKNAFQQGINSLVIYQYHII